MDHHTSGNQTRWDVSPCTSTVLGSAHRLQVGIAKPPICSASHNRWCSHMMTYASVQAEIKYRAVAKLKLSTAGGLGHSGLPPLPAHLLRRHPGEAGTAPLPRRPGTQRLLHATLQNPVPVCAHIQTLPCIWHHAALKPLSILQRSSAGTSRRHMCVRRTSRARWTCWRPPGSERCPASPS